tara:strand:- start:82 stop:411 length:330 start_codon:yes stop_codon:yes gene_type:complete
MFSLIQKDWTTLYPHWQITTRYLKMTNKQGNVEGILSNEDWRYNEDRLKLRSQCIHVLLNRFGSVNIHEVTYGTQNIYECADTWVSQGNASTSGIVAYFNAYFANKKDV